MEHDLDLRGVACPMNFVKTKLFLDKLPAGDLLNVLIDCGEPVDSVCQSLAQEGQEILARNEQSGGHFRVTIRKV
jgi:TusA-related sulfurtransferase